MHVNRIPLLLIAVLSAGILAGCDDDKEPNTELSLTRPLLLIDVPSYLEREPEIIQLGGTLMVQYNGVSESDPDVFLQEFEAPELAEFPERPTFENTDASDSEPSPRDGYFSPWRCGILGLSTLVLWEEKEGSGREEILDDLEDRLADACAHPASVPTASVQIDESDVRSVPTCDPLSEDAKVDLIFENGGSELLTMQVWTLNRDQVVETKQLQPGESASVELHIPDEGEGAGVEVFYPSQTEPPGGTSIGPGVGVPDSEYLVTGPPARLRQTGDIAVFGSCL
jgi:hypothetical protein